MLEAQRRYNQTNCVYIKSKGWEAVTIEQSGQGVWREKKEAFAGVKTENMQRPGGKKCWTGHMAG